jgi:hypothetical protein
MSLIPWEKFTGPLTLSKDALREERILWLIKCSDEEKKISDMEHFNRIYIYLAP